MHFDLIEFIRSFGIFGIWIVIGIIFFESFLLFFLPGDSLLFISGFLASTGHLNLWLLLIGCLAAAILGNNVGYFIGKNFGRRLFQRKNSHLFSKKNLEITQNFYAKHGKNTIILARFLPVVRTFAPIVAGIASMNTRIFFIYTIIGGALWTLGLILLGYFLGNLIPAALMEKYLIFIVILIIITSLLPSAWHVYQEYKQSHKK